LPTNCWDARSLNDDHEVKELEAALNSVLPGGLLGIPSMMAFGSAIVWFEACTKLAAKGCKAEDAESGKILDPAKGEDIATGAAMLQLAINRRKGQAMTEKRVAAGVAGGRKKLKLGGARLTEALALFVDLEWSVPAMADHFSMSTSTFLRRIEEETGIASRAVAIRLHREGNWPPLAKPSTRRRSSIKPV
jgi:AraC-like DNA-binding protein